MTSLENRWVDIVSAQMETTGEMVSPHPTSARRKRVVLFAAHYLPGFKDGGPVTSVVNIVKYLGSCLDFYIVTRDRDAGDEKPYEGIKLGVWQKVGKANVFYCPQMSARVVRKAIDEVSPDLIHMGSYFDTFTVLAVLLRRMGAFGDTPALVAPRGEFVPGCLAIKPTKKRIYRRLTRLFGLYDGLMWQAMGPLEKQQILDFAPSRRLHPDSIFVTRSITEHPKSTFPRPSKEPGSIKFCFTSRVNEKKGVDFALQVLARIRGKVEFNIFGPMAEKDEAYWTRCQQLMKSLPENVQARYRGSIEPSAVPQVLREHHFFILPTKGENYCHSAVESFLSGTPVLMSKDTPWRNLEEANAGFDISLQDPERWASVLQSCVDMDQAAYDRFLNGVQEYSSRFSVEDSVAQQRGMYESALALQAGELLKAGVVAE